MEVLMVIYRPAHRPSYTITSQVFESWQTDRGWRLTLHVRFVMHSCLFRTKWLTSQHWHSVLANSPAFNLWGNDGSVRALASWLGTLVQSTKPVWWEIVQGLSDGDFIVRHWWNAAPVNIVSSYQAPLRVNASMDTSELTTTFGRAHGLSASFKPWC